MSTTISFPSSPTMNQTYTYGSVTYIWNGTRWTINGGSVIYDWAKAPTKPTYQALEIIEDDTHRFVTDTDKSNWNALIGTAGNATHTGDVTGSVALTISDNVISYNRVSTSLRGISTQDSPPWDFSSSGIIVATLTSNITVSFTNYQTNKTLKMKITGNYTIDFSGFVKAKGSQNYNGNVVNYVYFDCWDSAVGAAATVYNIVQAE